MKKKPIFLPIFTLILAIAAVLRLALVGFRYSDDFQVYWNASRLWVHGFSPYLSSAGASGFVFKYPPWSLPLLTPLSFLSLSVAKGVWIAVQFFSLYAVWRWLELQKISRKVTIGVAILYWFIWLGHFASGQITLPVLALVLWASQTQSISRLVAATLGLALKVFSLVALLGLRERFVKRKTWAVLLGTLFVLQLVSVVPRWSRGENSFWEIQTTQYQEWFRAAGSGGSDLADDAVRGPANHGFTAGVLRAIGSNQTQTHWDVIVFVILAMGIGFLWSKFSGGLLAAEKWVGWLALSVVVHPLAWHHSFVMCFPLSAFAMDRAVRSQNRPFAVIALLGAIAVGVFVPQVIHEWARPLELVCVKSWGVLLSAYVLVKCRPSR